MVYANRTLTRYYTYSVTYRGVHKGVIQALDRADAANTALLTWGYCDPAYRGLHLLPSEV